MLAIRARTAAYDTTVVSCRERITRLEDLPFGVTATPDGTVAVLVVRIIILLRLVAKMRLPLLCLCFFVLDEETSDQTKNRVRVDHTFASVSAIYWVAPVSTFRGRHIRS